MSRNFRIFLIVFILSLPFWWVVNIFGKYSEDFFLAGFYQPPPQVFLAQIKPPEPIIQKIPPEIGAKSAISVKIGRSGDQQIVLEKNPDGKLPIASLTKLMTALVAVENYDLSQEILITREAADQPEDFGNLKVGERLSVENLLHIMLIESSNDAAYAIADEIGQETFVDLMNLEAERLGLESTSFKDPTGYNPENYSTSRDLVKLTSYIVKEEPLIVEILSLSEFNLYTPDGVFHHRILNTNVILRDYPEIIGGKTGYTREAGECFLLILKNPKNNNIFINVVLGSENRFEEMKKIIEYVL